MTSFVTFIHSLNVIPSRTPHHVFRWVKAGLSGAQRLPLERLAWMAGWMMHHGWVKPSAQGIKRWMVKAIYHPKLAV
jgi:hypothetical protein